MHYSRACALIDRNAFESNLKKIASGLKENTKIICVVKTNAYGHGAFMISEIAEMNDHVWGFAVATADEARELRDFGRKKEILILSHTFHDDYESMITNDVIMTVFNYDTALAIAETAIRLGKKARVHLKLDTGMSRIGFRPSKESLEEIGKVLSLKQLSVEGIFTHFATADEEDTTFAGKQLDEYNKFVALIEETYNYKFKMHHVANSAAAMYMKEGFFDAVRIGISMYGMWPSNYMKNVYDSLTPVMSLKARVAMVKEIQEGFGISYGRTFISDKPMKIATVSFGYGDGYPRSLSNKGYVLIHGSRCKIVGRVCMDQFMVDVTHLPDVKEYDEVTLIGTDGENSITMEELGELSGRFNYELACDINPRVHRFIV